MTPTLRLLLALLCLLLAACGRALPTWEPPLARAPVQRVRTTAYTHTESDHLPYGAQSACGTPLQYGAVHSAAADWSRWPNGTVFRIRDTGEVCQVDDYGWALAGTNTIDLYKPDVSTMNGWGVRPVNIEILQWGDVWQSYNVLRPRGSYAHVRRMLDEITHRYARGSNGSAPVVAASAPPPPAPQRPSPSAPPPRAQMVSAAPTPPPAPRASAAVGGAPLTPFYR